MGNHKDRQSNDQINIKWLPWLRSYGSWVLFSISECHYWVAIKWPSVLIILAMIKHDKQPTLLSWLLDVFVSWKNVELTVIVCSSIIWLQITYLISSNFLQITRNTPKIFVPPSVRRNYFKCAPLTWNPGSVPEVGGFLRLLRFPPPIKLTASI
jgi:hypothetical protein